MIGEPDLSAGLAMFEILSQDRLGLALLATLFVICLIMIFPLVASLRKRSLAKKRKLSLDRNFGPPRRELRGYTDRPHVNYLGRSRVDYPSDVGESTPAELEGERWMGGAMWFSLGVLVGAVAVALWGGSFGPSSTTVSPTLPPVERVSGASKPDRGTMVANYVEGVKRSLPAPVDELITLVDVRPSQGTVTLAFRVSSTMPSDERSKFQREAEVWFRRALCGPHNLGSIRELIIEAGTQFRLIFTDENSKAVANLNIRPASCRALQKSAS